MVTTCTGKACGRGPDGGRGPKCPAPLLYILRMWPRLIYKLGITARFGTLINPSAPMPNHRRVGHNFYRRQQRRFVIALSCRALVSHEVSATRVCHAWHRRVGSQLYST